MRALIIVAILVLLVLAGCATSPQRHPLDSAIGRLTIEQAIARFGPPSYERKNASGAAILSWIRTTYTTRDPAPDFGDPFGAGLRAGGGYERVTTAKQSSLTLGFDERGVLRWWRQQ
jgi:hypothetical protein